MDRRRDWDPVQLILKLVYRYIKTMLGTESDQISEVVAEVFFSNF